MCHRISSSSKQHPLIVFTWDRNTKLSFFLRYCLLLKQILKLVIRPLLMICYLDQTDDSDCFPNRNCEQFFDSETEIL